MGLLADAFKLFIYLISFLINLNFQSYPSKTYSFIACEAGFLSILNSEKIEFFFFPNSYYIFSCPPLLKTIIIILINCTHLI